MKSPSLRSDMLRFNVIRKHLPVGDDGQNTFGLNLCFEISANYFTMSSFELTSFSSGSRLMLIGNRETCAKWVHSVSVVKRMPIEKCLNTPVPFIGIRMKLEFTRIGDTKQWTTERKKTRPCSLFFRSAFHKISRKRLKHLLVPTTLRPFVRNATSIGHIEILRNA